LQAIGTILPRTPPTATVRRSLLAALQLAASCGTASTCRPPPKHGTPAASPRTDHANGYDTLGRISYGASFVILLPLTPSPARPCANRAFARSARRSDDSAARETGPRSQGRRAAGCALQGAPMRLPILLRRKAPRHEPRPQARMQARTRIRR
jgi:hypothetical protein